MIEKLTELVNSSFKELLEKPVYLTRVIGLNSDDSPIWRVEKGYITELRLDKDNLWIDACFGILHCCRPYTDFYFDLADAREAMGGVYC